MYELLQQTYMYKDNTEALKAEHHYGVLVRVFYQLLGCLTLRHSE